MSEKGSSLLDFSRPAWGSSPLSWLQSWPAEKLGRSWRTRSSSLYPRLQNRTTALLSPGRAAQLAQRTEKRAANSAARQLADQLASHGVKCEVCTTVLYEIKLLSCRTDVMIRMRFLLFKQAVKKNIYILYFDFNIWWISKCKNSFCQRSEKSCARTAGGLLDGQRDAGSSPVTRSPASGRRCSSGPRRLFAACGCKASDDLFLRPIWSA